MRVGFILERLTLIIYFDSFVQWEALNFQKFGYQK